MTFCGAVALFLFVVDHLVSSVPHSFTRGPDKGIATGVSVAWTHFVPRNYVFTGGGFHQFVQCFVRGHGFFFGAVFFAGAFADLIFSRRICAAVFASSMAIFAAFFCCSISIPAWVFIFIASISACALPYA